MNWMKFVPSTTLLLMDGVCLQTTSLVARVMLRKVVTVIWQQHVHSLLGLKDIRNIQIRVKPVSRMCAV
jgi:hypothetical protein